MVKRLTAERTQEILARIPMRRFGTVDEIAGGVAVLGRLFVCDGRCIRPVRRTRHLVRKRCEID
jgi:hypothetical protein